MAGEIKGLSLRIAKSGKISVDKSVERAAALYNLFKFKELKNRQIYFLARAGIFKQSRRARNQVGIGLSYRPARLHRLAELISWNRFLGSINVYK